MGSDRLRLDRWRRGLIAAALLLLLVQHVSAQQQSDAPIADSATAADHIANAFSQLGDQIYDECIFELSEEQLEVQQALIQAYVARGASSTFARQLAVKQIQPPRLSEKCEEIRSASKTTPPSDWSTNIAVAKPPKPEAIQPKSGPETFAPALALADKKVLQQWDCAPNVDFVTIKHKGYDRKLTGGEICNPFRDVVHKVPDALKTFRLGYTIRTGRLFVISDDPQYNGRTIAWAISGREICRNNPDPDCLAARAVGPIPPGEYSFADKSHRVSWGPTSKRMVAGVYLSKLWHKERYTRAQAAAILARSNIAIHVRLKGEMSEACLGLEPQGWAYVSGLIKDGRATGLAVHVDEPHPQIAEKAPILAASTFSLSSLFKAQ
ncbi:MAG: DUF2778 domain-containing protein [Hyphomicrobiaceae bacterium]